MSLGVGSRLGHYHVTALIGEGGMGQVYQATDTKLNRQVALKILPEAFATDPDRLARFQREAQVLASLNHPGIAAIYGLEESEGTRALVLELVEGPTLADRIAQGAIPVDPPTDRAQFAWAYRPCDELAGDIFNVVQIDDRHVGMYVVDVSGHGVPSALLSVSVARNLIPHSDRSSLVVEPDADGQEHLVVGPADVASRLNGLYRMDEKNRYYFTLLYGILDTREGLFRYASAGHPGPIRVRPSDPPRIYTQQAIPISMMDVSTYEEAAIDLRTGDRLYLYSDGVTEETNPDDEPFGDERVLQALDESRELTLDESVQSLVESVLSWHGVTQLSDDLSVLAVEVQ